MLKTAFIIYRDWGYQIFKQIYKYQLERADFSLDTLIVAENAEITIDKKYQSKLNFYYVLPQDTQRIYKLLKKHKIQLAFFYSWSFLVSHQLLTYFTCLCLHPSRLPRFRGGTPIQNQLTKNVNDSAVTIFKMNNKIDAGDIYEQASMSLIGDVQNIFTRMIDLGSILTKDLITDAVNQELNFKTQRSNLKTKIYQRRKPDQSEIKLKTLKNMTYKQINNLVRGLLPPYPVAFISTNRHKILIYRLAKYVRLPTGSQLVTADSQLNKKATNIYIELNDSFAKMVKFELTNSI